jgi:Ala-tRNA(Pro) deacylase
MPASPGDLFALLDRLGIVTATVEHPPLFTVEQSRELRGAIPGAHTKNLFLADRKNRLFVVSAREDARIELKRLHAKLGASGRFSFGKPEALREVLGIEPGSVSPFAAINDTTHRVTFVLDHALLDQDDLNFHPLVNTSTTRIKPGDLLRFFAATGHDPLVAIVSERAPERPA